MENEMFQPKAIEAASTFFFLERKHRNAELHTAEAEINLPVKKIERGEKITGKNIKRLLRRLIPLYFFRWHRQYQ